MPRQKSTPSAGSAPTGTEQKAPGARVTVIDIAARAQVSVMTVSRTLSGKGYVAEATRQRVMQVAESMGYVPNLGAKALKGGRTNVLGLLVSDFQSPVIAATINAVSRVVKENGFDLIIYDIGDDASGRPRTEVVPLLTNLCDGLLLVLPGRYAEQLEQFQRSEVPIVLLNYWRGPTSLPVVRADNYEGALALTQHLIGLGHRRIGFIQGTAYSGQSQERERGYLAALREAGIEAEGALLATGDFTQRSGCEQALQLLQARHRPTAVFAANDLMALGALDAARKLGLSVPEDLSVVGFDDIPAAEHAHPPLTTVRQDYQQLGDSAVRLLLQQLAHGAQRGIRVELQSSLVLRESAAAPRVTPPPTRRGRATAR